MVEGKVRRLPTAKGDVQDFSTQRGRWQMKESPLIEQCMVMRRQILGLSSFRPFCRPPGLVATTCPADVARLEELV
jgi:hypothetical protein